MSGGSCCVGRFLPRSVAIKVAGARRLSISLRESNNPITMLKELLVEPERMDPHFRVKDWMGLTTLFLKLAGMCHVSYTQWLPRSLALLSPLINYCVCLFFVFDLIHIMCMFGMQVRDKYSGKIDKVITNAISQIIIYSFALYAFLHFQLKRKEYLRLCDFMNQKFRQRSAQGLTFITTERIYFHARRLQFLWTFGCVYTTCSWALIPLFKKDQLFPIMIDYPFLNQTVSGSNRQVTNSTRLTISSSRPFRTIRSFTPCKCALSTRSE